MDCGEVELMKRIRDLRFELEGMRVLSQSNLFLNLGKGGGRVKKRRRFSWEILDSFSFDESNRALLSFTRVTNVESRYIYFIILKNKFRDVLQ